MKLKHFMCMFAILLLSSISIQAFPLVEDHEDPVETVVKSDIDFTVLNAVDTAAVKTVTIKSQKAKVSYVSNFIFIEQEVSATSKQENPATRYNKFTVPWQDKFGDTKNKALPITQNSSSGGLSRMFL